jgi:hypothetical protein
MSAARHFLTLVVVTAATLGFSTQVLSQTDTVSVNDPRPLQAAVISLLEKYPVTITYEDPRYVYSSDVRDATIKEPPPGKLRHMIPNGGVLQATYEVSEETGQPTDFASAIQAIIDAQNVSTVGGRFAVLQNGQTFHVVPSEIRDSRGAWIKQPSVLDTPITFSSGGPVDGFQLLDGIVKEISTASGQRFWGVNPGRLMGSLFRYQGEVEAKDEPARDVLMSVLRSIGPRFTYLLDYDPAGQAYMLSIWLSAAPPEEPKPSLPRPKAGDPKPGGGVVTQDEAQRAQPQ